MPGVGSGYVVKSLEAALWAFQSTSTFEEGALKVANLGDDADTTAAIYGQLAGGPSSSPLKDEDKRLSACYSALWCGEHSSALAGQAGPAPVA